MTPVDRSHHHHVARDTREEVKDYQVESADLLLETGPSEVHDEVVPGTVSEAYRQDGRRYEAPPLVIIDYLWEVGVTPFRTGETVVNSVVLIRASNQALEDDNHILRDHVPRQELILWPSKQDCGGDRDARQNLRKDEGVKVIRKE